MKTAIWIFIAVAVLLLIQFGANSLVLLHPTSHQVPDPLPSLQQFENKMPK